MLRHITPEPQENCQPDSVQRTRFFDAYDGRFKHGHVSLRELTKQHGIARSTAYEWLNDRHNHGSVAYRRRDIRALHSELKGTNGSGRPYKISDTQLKSVLDSDKDARRKRLSTQLRNAGISTCRDTLRKSLKERFSAGMFKAALQKEISDDNAAARKAYCQDFRFFPVEGFWDCLVFTDEAHCSLSDFPDEWILRVLGERHQPKNMVTAYDTKANCVHFAAWVNYYDKAPELTFYNDEYDNYVAPKSEPKPRRRPITDHPGDYETRVAEWEAKKVRELEHKKPGNSMRAVYYTEKILPIYCAAVDSLKARSDKLRPHIHEDLRYIWLLIEDNDPSHGTKKSSLPPSKIP